MQLQAEPADRYVTVEELRSEGEEPKLTAETLAERIGESLGSDDDLL